MLNDGLILCGRCNEEEARLVAAHLAEARLEAEVLAAVIVAAVIVAVVIVAVLCPVAEAHVAPHQPVAVVVEDKVDL